jgi:hypothetical protein
MCGISRARRSFYRDLAQVLLTVAKGGEAALCLRTWISGDMRMDGLLGLERCWWCAVGEMGQG